MLHVICLVIYATSSVAGLVLPRDDSPPDSGDATVADLGLQTVPDTAKSSNTFSNGQPKSFKGFHLVQIPHQTSISRETSIFHSVV